MAGKPCCGEDLKVGERRLQFLGPRTDRKPGSVFVFGKFGISLTVGLCYTEAEVGQNLAATLVIQGSAKWVVAEEPKKMKVEIKKVEKVEKPTLKRRLFGKDEKGDTSTVDVELAPEGGD